MLRQYFNIFWVQTMKRFLILSKNFLKKLFLVKVLNRIYWAMNNISGTVLWTCLLKFVKSHGRALQAPNRTLLWDEDSMTASDDETFREKCFFPVSTSTCSVCPLSNVKFLSVPLARNGVLISVFKLAAFMITFLKCFRGMSTEVLVLILITEKSCKIYGTSFCLISRHTQGVF